MAHPEEPSHGTSGRSGLSFQNAAGASVVSPSGIAGLSFRGPSSNDEAGPRPKQVAVNAKHYAVLVTDVKQVCSYDSIGGGGGRD